MTDQLFTFTKPFTDILNKSVISHVIKLIGVTNSHLIISLKPDLKSCNIFVLIPFIISITHLLQYAFNYDSGVAIY